MNIDYQKRDDFMKQAKTWLLRQAGYIQEDPRFSSIYTIIDQEAAEQSMLLITAAQFPPNSIIYHFGDRMHSLFDGEKATQMENVAPYLIGSQDIVDFLQNLKEEPELIFRNEELSINYTTEKAFKGVMLLKTKKSLDEVRKHLRRFTQIKSADGYDEHGNLINERWVYFLFTEQSTTQEWLRNSEPETTSHFMKPFDEILFARCDTCSFHHIKTNKDKIIENPKYPNLNGGFLLTERQSNALITGRKEVFLGEVEHFLYEHHNDISENIDNMRDYLSRIWKYKKKYHGEEFTLHEFIASSVISLLLGEDYMRNDVKQSFLNKFKLSEIEIYNQKLKDLGYNEKRGDS